MISIPLVCATASFYSMVYNGVMLMYPLEAASHDISPSYIGQVAGIYSVANFAILPITLCLLKKYSEIMIHQLGLLLLITVLVLVAILPFIRSPALFLFVSFTFRIIEGIADSMVNMATMTLIQSESNETRQKTYLNLFTGIISISGAVGPFLVSMLMPSLGFTGFYLMMATILVSVFIICRILLRRPSKKDFNDELFEGISYNDTAATQTLLTPLDVSDQLIGFKQILKNGRVLMTAIYSVFVCAIWCFRDPILSLHLSQRGVEKQDVGYFYLTQTLSNAIFGLGPLLFANRFAPKTIMVASSLLMIVSLLMVGPSSIMGFGTSLTTVAVGLGLLGFTFNFTYSPILSELREGLQAKYPGAESPEKLSLIFMATRSLGYWIGPMGGSSLYGWIGFAGTCDVFALAFVSFICVYSNVFGFMLRLCRPSKRMYEKSEYQLVAADNMFQ